jgi:hypothetical protein
MMETQNRPTIPSLRQFPDFCFAVLIRDIYAPTVLAKTNVFIPYRIGAEGSLVVAYPFALGNIKRNHSPDGQPANQQF